MEPDQDIIIHMKKVICAMMALSALVSVSAQEKEPAEQVRNMLVFRRHIVL